MRIPSGLSTLSFLGGQLTCLSDRSHHEVAQSGADPDEAQPGEAQAAEVEGHVCDIQPHETKHSPAAAHHLCSTSQAASMHTFTCTFAGQIYAAVGPEDYVFNLRCVHE